MFKRLGIFAATLGAALCAVTQAGATPIANPYGGPSTAVYTSWSGALSGSPTELNMASLNGNETSPKALGGFTFSGFTKVRGQEFEGSSINIAAPSGGETAMILSIYDQAGYDFATSFTLTLSDGETSGPVTLSASSACIGSQPCEWFGFTDASSITSLTLTASGGTLSIADFWYGTAAGQGSQQNPAPEASTVLLTSGGLLVLLSSCRTLIYKNVV